jgi:hypothetical protein
LEVRLFDFRRSLALKSSLPPQLISDFTRKHISDAKPMLHHEDHLTSAPGRTVMKALVSPIFFAGDALGFCLGVPEVSNTNFAPLSTREIGPSSAVSRSQCFIKRGRRRRWGPFTNALVAPRPRS